MIDFETILDGLDGAVWIYDIDASRIHWANRAALELWTAATVDELRERDLATEMSPKVAEKLKQYQEDFARRDASFYETWTLYPQGRPTRLRVKCRGFRLPDGRVAMLAEAKEIETAEPETIRGLEALLHTNVMISMFGENGVQLYCNPAARARFGGDVRRFSDRLAMPAIGEAFVSDVRRSGTSRLTAEVIGRDGRFWHQIIGVSCRDALTGQQAVLVSESDVTALHDAQLELERARNRAVRNDNLKSDFLANTSHEIRTPINGIIGMADALDAASTEPGQKLLIRTIRESGETLLALINDILDISKIEAGMLTIERITFEPEDILRRAEGLHGLHARDKGISFSTAIEDAALPARIGDPHRILQIVNNLVSNAVKFTEKGEVSVRISVEPNGQLVIQVADTGIGMNEEQMDRVFETFAQGDSSTTRKFGGTGLGMPIVDRLVALMSGRIDMSSRVGIGTSVRVSLPLPLARDEAKAAPVETKAITFDYEVSILAADDVSTNRAVLSALFSVHEITSDVVASGQDAVERVGSQDYDLYFLDISMPEMDGIETLRAIRARERSLGLDPVPAVAVTAHTFPNQVDGFLEDGFDAHLAKPIRSAKLVDCIQRHLNRSITRERVARRTGTEP